MSNITIIFFINPLHQLGRSFFILYNCIFKRLTSGPPTMSQFSIVVFTLWTMWGYFGSSEAGFLSSPFEYFVHPGEPITSVASPYIHGFGSPLVQQPLVFKNFYTHEPFLNSWAPQPVFYHQPQFVALPTPQFYTFPQTNRAPSAEYGAPSTHAQEQRPEPTGYSPSGTSSSNNQFQKQAGYNSRPSESGYNSGPSESGFNASPSGSSSSNSQSVEPFEDVPRDDQQSISVNSDRTGDQPFSSNDFQTFNSNRAYRDNSVRNPEEEQRSYRNTQRQYTTSNAGY